MTEMTDKQKKNLWEMFDEILHELYKAKDWSIDVKKDIRELTVSELIEADLIKDGYAHMEDMGRRTIIIKYQINKRRKA